MELQLYSTPERLEASSLASLTVRLFLSETKLLHTLPWVCWESESHVCEAPGTTPAHSEHVRGGAGSLGPCWEAGRTEAARRVSLSLLFLPLQEGSR